MRMLNDLKNRGVQDVLFCCLDGLPSFKEAIGAVFPQAQIQRCVIHMLRNSFKYVNYSDLKKFSSDFKQCTMPQARRQAWTRWRTSGRNGGGNIPMPSATERTTGKTSAPSSSSRMKSGE